MAQFYTEIKKELGLFYIDFHELILCYWRLFWISFYIRYSVLFFFSKKGWISSYENDNRKVACTALYNKWN